MSPPQPDYFPPYLQWWPFPGLRDHQSKVLRLIDSENLLMLQAPTGFGKSVLTLAGIWHRMVQGKHHNTYLPKLKPNYVRSSLEISKSTLLTLQLIS